MTNEEAANILLNAYEYEVQNDGRACGKTNFRIALLMGINALNVLKTYKWKCDVAIKQLEELGLNLGQNVNAANVVPKKQYEELREDFVDLVCSGTNNPAPYCKNRRDECVDWYGYCTYNNCNGFNPDGRNI